MGESNRALARVFSPPSVDHRPAVPAGFAEFYRDRYRELIRVTMYFGAGEADAHDAVAAAAAEVLTRWDEINNPYQYARTAAISHFVKSRARALRWPGGPALRDGHLSGLGHSDTTAEDRQFVIMLLGQLPQTQRQVMALTIDGYGTGEIADYLGQSGATVLAVRREGRRRLRDLLESGRLENQRALPGPTSTAEAQ
ncbi:hypothetical protein ABT336_20875 [Micromonospora sp. NPDC000207]|uniref:hypothetical protein n=1 Tax=Micromonospora sp. NPDC000207 TaxID=3154246 RepID=UPI003318FEC3